MPPIKKRIVESLDKLCLKNVLSSIMTDLYLMQLLNRDLKDSMLLHSFRIESKEQLLNQISYRLQILPGILNDQVRHNLIKEFFIQKNQNERWQRLDLDLLKVLLDESVTSLSLGLRRLPFSTMALIRERCPNLTHLQMVLSEDDSTGRHSLPILRQATPLPETNPPQRKRRKVSQSPLSELNKTAPSFLDESPSSSLSEEFPLRHLTEVSVKVGATNDLLSSLGQSCSELRRLDVTQSSAVTDAGVKMLCLKHPDNHARGRRLHELRVRSFHLNPCCTKLTEVVVVGTRVTRFGLAFLLKHLSLLESVGESRLVCFALDVLIGGGGDNTVARIIRRPTALRNAVKRHVFKYKLRRITESQASPSNFMIVSWLCPELRELSFGDASQKGIYDDLSRAAVAADAQRCGFAKLKHLKELTLLNVSVLWVSEWARAVGSRLTSLRVKCLGLDLPAVLVACPNLTHLNVEGPYVTTPYESLAQVRSQALRHLECAVVRSQMPSCYVDLFLSSSKKLRELDLKTLGEIVDKRVESLIKSGHLSSLQSLSVETAPQLTLRAATALLDGCPRLTRLKSLAGWNISSEQLHKLEEEVEKKNFDVDITCSMPPNSREADSDASSDASIDYHSDLIDVFRNILPFVFVEHR